MIMLHGYGSNERDLIQLAPSLRPEFRYVSARAPQKMDFGMFGWFPIEFTPGGITVDREAARVLVEEGPLRVEELLAWDTRFDRENGELLRTLEGAHSRHRVLHANGDATGAEIGRALLAHAEAHARVTLREWTLTTDLLMDGDEAVGVVMMDRDGRQTQVRARAVLLASGGAGQVYSDTTNPAVATGDGIAMAAPGLRTWSFTSFIPRRSACRGWRAFCCQRRCAARARCCAMRRASSLWSATTR